MRTLFRLVGALTLAAAPSLLACGGDDGAFGAIDASADVLDGAEDAGPDIIPGLSDGGAPDAGVPMGLPGFPADPGRSETGGFDDASCASTCAPGCQQPSCCVADASAGCCRPTPDGLTEFPLDICTDPVTCGFAGLFGSVEARETGIEGARGWTGGGNLQSDGGALLSDAFDLRSSSLIMRATFASPAGCDACLDELAVGVVASIPDVDDRRADSAVSLRYAPALASGQMHLMVEDVILARFEVPDAPTSTWTLELRPTGDVLVTDPMGAVRTFAVAWSPAVVTPAFFGRSQNPGDEVPSRLTYLSLETALCDVPDAWRDIESVRFASPDDPVPDAPAVFVDTSPVGPGDVVISGGQGPVRIRARAAGGTLGSSHIRADGIEDAFDIDVIQVEDEWWMFYRNEEATEIRRARAPVQRDALFVADSAALVTLSTCACDRLDAPTAAARMVDAALIVRVTRAGVTHLEPFSVDAAGATSLPDSQLPELTENAGEASLVNHHGTWQLYTHRTRGTRGYLVLSVSDSLLYWRDLGTAFSGAPASGGFDALGVESFDLATEGDVQVLYYVGYDGVRRTLGAARRDSPALPSER